jgi:ketosteroid isomerase-like protein
MIRGFTWLVVLLGVLAGASCAQHVDAEQETAALTAADAEWLKTSKDIDKFTSFFTPEGTVSMAAAPAASGAKAIKDLIGPVMASPGYNLTWTPTRIVVSSAGDLGYTAGRYQLTLNNPNGEPVPEMGKYQAIWKKVDGAWKVLEMTAGPNAPTPVSATAVVAPAALMKWTDAPASLPPGAKAAMIVGDLARSGPFTGRLTMPDGYRILPHTHPTDENVTVLSGTLRIGPGAVWDDKVLNDLAPGSYANLSAGRPHFMVAKGTTVIQVHGIGPLVLDYVNPADDPTKK